MPLLDGILDILIHTIQDTEQLINDLQTLSFVLDFDIS